MLAGERVLLYSLSLALGALLVRELIRPETTPGPAPAAAAGSGNPWQLTDANGKLRLSATLEAEGAPKLVLYDAQGRPGMELKLGIDGQAQLNLTRETSQLQLGVDELGAVACRLHAGDARQQMVVQPSGAAEWRLTGKGTDPEAIVRLDPAGIVSWEFIQVGRAGKISAALDRTGQGALQLISERKTFAQMFLAANGEVEMGVGGGPHGIEALMRTDQVGAAEVALSSPHHSGGPRLSMLPSGEMGMRVLGTEGQTGPVMQMFKDGSAEITIVDTKSQRGPVMYRGTDGASLVGIRGDKGSPGPRLYQGPKLESLISIPGVSGSQIGLYGDPATSAFLVIAGSDGKPTHVFPPEAAARFAPKTEESEESKPDDAKSAEAKKAEK